MRIPRTDTQIHATRYRMDKPRMEVTVASCIERCVREGIECAGIVEHLGGWRHPVECLIEMANELRGLDPPIPVFLGMEVNCTGPDGSTTGTEADKERAGLDFVLAESASAPEEIASVESFIEYDHRCRMAVTRHPWVDVVVHPYTTHAKRLRRAGWEGEWRFDLIPERFLVEWADALAVHRTACEINTKNIAFFEEPRYLFFIDELVKREVRIAVGSDAHRPEKIGSTRPIYVFLEERNVPPGLIWIPRR